MTPHCLDKFAKVEHKPHTYIFGGNTKVCNGYKEKEA